ncbi:type II toxin-antitoxin system HicA family toxin [bacterium]|nr:type II toxin-antitoxin system HicA family toxin [FCB group bacterium]MBL7190478.1 type II toxin-antitoxin system HicA family toxin [bacterium]
MGFIVHHHKGSHVFLYHPEKYSTIYVIVPYHHKDLKPGVMKDILSHPAIDQDEFIELL